MKCGTINYPTIPNAVSISVDSFNTEQQIYLYFATESNETVLLNEVKYYHFSMHFKHKIISIDSTIAPYGYLEYLPETYDNSKIPLIIFLHGSGGVGAGHYKDLINPNTCMREGLTRYLELDMDLPAVVLSPQYSSFVPATFDAFLEFAKQHYNVDTSKICITGISLGGAAVWSYIRNYPQKVSAAIPLCGATVLNNGFEVLKNLPVWAFHNDKDPTVPVSSTYQNINGIIKAGGHPFMSIFRADDHSCAYEAYYHPGLWDWAFAQNINKGYVPKGLVNAEKTSQSVKIDGFFAEKAWENRWHAIPDTVPENVNANAWFKLIWDQNYLYSGVCLSKDAFVNTEKEIAIFFNGNNSISGIFDVYDFKYTFNLNDTVGSVNAISEGIFYKWAETDSSYNFELAYPFRKTIYSVPAIGDGYGYDISVKAGSSDLFWKGNSLDSLNTQLFGRVILSGETNDEFSEVNFLYENSTLCLDQNYPNPFKESSTIKYSVKNKGWVYLKIYDYTGKVVKVLVDKAQNPGVYSVKIFAKDFAKGIYLYSLRSGSISLNKRFVVN
jgi:predicted esterase